LDEPRTCVVIETLTSPAARRPGRARERRLLLHATYQLENATAINDNGQIVVSANDTATNQTHILLLTPN
jgi:hypothetical protein